MQVVCQLEFEVSGEFIYISIRQGVLVHSHGGKKDLSMRMPHFKPLKSGNRKQHLKRAF
ncbi:hypothetical protein PMEGAPL103_50830 [Priestia megaterium]